MSTLEPTGAARETPPVPPDPSRSQAPGTDAPDHTGHPAVQRVIEVLAAHGLHPRVVSLPGAVRTAAAAAEALRVSPAEIANSVVFVARDENDDVTPLLVMTSGAHRVDTVKVSELTGIPFIERADADFVRERTGFAIGGVAPVGHLAPIRTIVDVSLSRYDHVWAAAGHSHTVFQTTYEELLRVTAGQPMEVI